MTVDFSSLASQCAPEVEISTLAALVRHESGFQVFAIHINGPAKLSRQPTNLAEASNVAQGLIDKGYDIDLGLGQINSRNLQRLGLTVSSAFDACRNLQAASKVLQQWCYQPFAIKFGAGQVALRAALDCYHAGLRGVDRDHGSYTRSVLQAARWNQTRSDHRGEGEQDAAKDLP